MGEHIFVTEDSARKTIDTGIEYLLKQCHHEARTKAFEDCSKYWEGEVRKIVEFGAPATDQLAKIKQLFKINE